MKTKCCNKCKKRKPLSKFHRDKTKPDGVRGICGECVNTRTSTYRKANPYKRYKFKSMGKSMMRLFTNTLIGEGLIVEPDRCEVCNKKQRLHPHHNNYFDPFDIVFVCKKCHNAIHHDEKEDS